ncbi:MAG TPA: hypothetical protein VEO95_10720 [Chthoniobacteraceae bacterium]|nr:hypothetical protein [Chthoniobacteraceae bacterium]
MKHLRLFIVVLVFAASPLLHAEPPTAKTAAFLRTTDLPESARGLQTGSTEYRPASGSGASVWLIGVAHLGTAEYFKAIQQRLDRQTVVLYEGIGIHDVQQGPGALKGDSGIQGTLADALGLKFQLDAIDYRRASFINSDLRAPELEHEVKQRGADSGSASDETFNQLVDALQGTGMMGGALTQMIGFLGSSPQMREMTKLMLIEVLGQAGELIDAARNLSPDVKDLFDVILTQRNAVVIRDLRAQLARLKPGQSVAVFYGAAHMDEIAQRLRDELHYAPVKTEWDTAFSASSAQSGIDAAQVRMMLDLLRTQLKPER